MARRLRLLDFLPLYGDGPDNMADQRRRRILLPVHDDYGPAFAPGGDENEQSQESQQIFHVFMIPRKGRAGSEYGAWRFRYNRRIRTNPKRKEDLKKLIFAALVAAFAAGCSQVDSGEAALRSVWGNIEGETIQPGLVWHNPLSTDIIVYDCRFRLADYRMESYTKDMQQATLGVAFNYAIDPSRLRELHIKYGLQYGSKILDPIVYGAVKDVIGNW